MGYSNGLFYSRVQNAKNIQFQFKLQYFTTARKPVLDGISEFRLMYASATPATPAKLIIQDGVSLHPKSLFLFQQIQAIEHRSYLRHACASM